MYYFSPNHFHPIFLFFVFLQSINELDMFLLFRETLIILLDMTNQMPALVIAIKRREFVPMNRIPWEQEPCFLPAPRLPLFVSHAQFLKYIYSNITITYINSDISFLLAALLYLNFHFIWPLLKTSLFLKLYSLLFPPNFPSFIK